MLVIDYYVSFCRGGAVDLNRSPSRRPVIASVLQHLMKANKVQGDSSKLSKGDVKTDSSKRRVSICVWPHFESAEADLRQV